MIEIKINIPKGRLNVVEKMFVKLSSRGGIPKVETLRFIGETMVKSIKRNFIEQGRPEKWKSLSPMTLAMRKKGTAIGTPRILMDKGILFGSITYALTSGEAGVLVGTSNIDRNPRLHQYGGEIAIPQRVILPKRAKALRFMVGGKEIFAKKVTQKARVVTIPARPFLLFQEEDKEDIRRLLVNDLIERAKSKD